MVDRRIEELERLLRADPNDERVRLDYFLARARVEGSQVFLEPLAKAWNEVGKALQDEAIREVARRLGDKFSFVETETYRQQGVEQRVATFRENRLGMDFQLIPAGRFVMGSHSDHGRADGDEHPDHPVHISKAFLLGRFPVTRRDWTEQSTSNASEQFSHPDYPMHSVSWSDVRDWLEIGGLRLPTESEWEYACRAGSRTDYFWGDKMDEDYVWFRKNSETRPRSVHEHESMSNGFGLVDMLGNVDEWLEDHWVGSYETGPNDEQARLLRDDDADRCVRGGNWEDTSLEVRCSYRFWMEPDYRGLNTGFRAAYTLPDFDSGKSL